MSYLKLLAIAVSYLLLVRLVRYRRRDGILQRFSFKNREDMASMSLSDAALVMRELAEREFPIMFYTAISFGLFKTYGIPTISKLLVATSQLSGDTTASKRRTDTGVLMSEIMFNKPECPRSIDAIARVNFLHDRWRKAGKISNEDMLYTLSMFAIEPIRWINWFEWRDLTMVEKNAMAIFWKDVGNEMEISYDCLAPYMKEKDDPLAWLEGLQAWGSKYEEHHMVYSVPNKKLADANAHLLLMDFPKFTHSFVFSQLCCVMEPRLRHAMGYEDPGRFHFVISEQFMALRRNFLKYLSLPRPDWWSVPRIQDVDKKTGRYFSPTYLAHPYYVKPSLYSRWGPAAIYSRLIGGHLPGDEGRKYLPEGYLFPEIGPDSQRGKGKEYMDVTRARISRARGCPMAVQV
ncbi:hypothetical protein CCHL11_04991 [Colletotrichum chlorophyti]|uniref:Mycophenolic acid synthesis protein B n=1 Tax=Colletotrichum chlorophyti TaxID=708187 RepID=A0A1Q8S2C7_9PEZI|nr:hypothetical protein CCHL11_04991 [Colletotrichum chlorophyti]